MVQRRSGADDPLAWRPDPASPRDPPSASSAERAAHAFKTGGARARRRRPERDEEEEHQWLDAWQSNEISWLIGRVEKLERRLRWRTIALASVLVLSWLTTIAAIGLDLESPDRVDRISERQAAPSLRAPPAIVDRPEPATKSMMPSTAPPAAAAPSREPPSPLERRASGALEELTAEPPGAESRNAQ